MHTNIFWENSRKSAIDHDEGTRFSCKLMDRGGPTARRKLLTKGGRQLCGRSITPEYRPANYWEKWRVTKGGIAMRNRANERASGRFGWNVVLTSIERPRCPASRLRTFLPMGDPSDVRLADRDGNAKAPIPSPPPPTIVGGTEKRNDDVGIPFGNARARRNKRNVLHCGANGKKVPRRTKSPRSFISREKPRVG